MSLCGTKTTFARRGTYVFLAAKIDLRPTALAGGHDRTLHQHVPDLREALDVGQPRLLGEGAQDAVDLQQVLE